MILSKLSFTCTSFLSYINPIIDFNNIIILNYADIRNRIFIKLLIFHINFHRRKRLFIFSIWVTSDQIPKYIIWQKYEYITSIF